MSVISDFVSVLNNQEIGKQVLEESNTMLNPLRPYGLEDRTISAVMEPIAWKIIKSNADCKVFDVEVKPPQHRTFYDCTLVGEPTDFKATKGTTQDNLSAPGALLYCVSGDLVFSESKKRLNMEFLPRFKDAADQAIADNLNKDFSYLILNKDTGLFGYATLKSLRLVALNQSNFLQASWIENINKPVNRTTKEFVKWITPYLENFRGYKSK